MIARTAPSHLLRFGACLLGLLLVSGACKKRDEGKQTDSGESESGADASGTSAPASGFTMVAKRKGFETAHAVANPAPAPPAKPPAELFELVRYPAPLGKNAAYVTPVKEGEKRPAIVWIHGGFDFGIGDAAWEEAPRENDQSASAFREAGIVLMLPSLRGTNDSAGKRECFLGEVDDIVAAAKYLATRPDVDPKRIYLGGHSTGGLLALLVAVTSDEFRGIIAFGPTLSVLSYGRASCIPEDASDEEALVRTAGLFLKEIKTPTYIIEGAQGNDLSNVREYAGDAPVTLTLVPSANHFTVLRPGSEHVAEAILAAESETLAISAEAIQKRMAATPPEQSKQ